MDESHVTRPGKRQYVLRGVSEGRDPRDIDRHILRTVEQFFGNVDHIAITVEVKGFTSGHWRAEFTARQFFHNGMPPAVAFDGAAVRDA